MKYKPKILFSVVVFYFLAQLFGIYIISNYLVQELPYGLEPPQITTQESPLYLITSIIIVTGLFLLLYKIKFGRAIKVWFAFALIICISISLSAFIASTIAIIVSAVMIGIKFKEKDVYVHNLTEVLAYAGISTLLLPLFNIFAVVLFLMIVAVYDFVAVYVTKHMIKLVKVQKSIGIFTGVTIIEDKEAAMIGGGDFVLPLLFSGVVFRDFGFMPSIFVIVGASLSLLFLLIIGKKKHFYPAIPFLLTGSLLGFLIGQFL